jgi:hypothetical protein
MSLFKTALPIKCIDIFTIYHHTQFWTLRRKHVCYTKPKLSLQNSSSIWPYNWIMHFFKLSYHKISRYQSMNPWHYNAVILPPHVSILYIHYYYFLWLCSPARAIASSYHEVYLSHTHTHTHTYIYIYIEREREREREYRLTQLIY